MRLFLDISTRKYPLREYILGVQMHLAKWDRHRWGRGETLKCGFIIEKLKFDAQGLLIEIAILIQYVFNIY